MWLIDMAWIGIGGPCRVREEQSTEHTHDICRWRYQYQYVLKYEIIVMWSWIFWSRLNKHGTRGHMTARSSALYKTNCDCQYSEYVSRCTWCSGAYDNCASWPNDTLEVTARNFALILSEPARHGTEVPTAQRTTYIYTRYIGRAHCYWKIQRQQTGVSDLDNDV